MLKKSLFSLCSIRLLAAGLWAVSAALTGTVMAQNTAAGATSPANPEPQCILAGRLDGDQRWAPQARGVELLDAAGKRVAVSDKTALANVKQVRLSSPALLSACNGNQALVKGDDLAGTKKSTAPAVSAGKTPITVEAVSFPPLRVGGELVELRLGVPADRVVALTR
jgi:hypothetical protein